MAARDHKAPPSWPALFERIRPLGAVLFEPAAPGDMTACRELLAKLDRPMPPTALEGFWQAANGLTWNAIELWGTKPVPRPERDYVFSGIADANEAYGKTAGLRGLLLIGETDEDYLVYDPADRRYHEIDRFGQERYRSHADLTSMMKELIEERLPPHRR